MLNPERVLSGLRLNVGEAMDFGTRDDALGGDGRVQERFVGKIRDEFYKGRGA